MRGNKVMIERKKLIYLASPYSDPCPAVREDRFLHICSVAAKLMRAGYFVLSPIAHCHAIDAWDVTSGGWGYWAEYDKRLMQSCDEVWVCCMQGWRDSIGVRAEIQIAGELCLPVRYISGHGEPLTHAPKNKNSLRITT
jgi:hypothetical protein